MRVTAISPLVWGGLSKTSHVSFVVTDTEVCHRAMGEFRSEDLGSVDGARYQADLFAARLERECLRAEAA